MARLMANHYCGAFTFLVLYTTSSMRSGSSLCPFFSVRRRSADPSRSVLPSSSPSVLLLSASHRCSPGRRSELLRLRSVLGGSVVLAVVGLGLRAAALAVAVASLAAPALIACLSEAVLPRGATVGFESHGFFVVALLVPSVSVPLSFFWLVLLSSVWLLSLLQLLCSIIC